MRGISISRPMTLWPVMILFPGAVAQEWPYCPSAVLPPPLESGDYETFGESLASDGERLAVGVPGYEDDGGRVVVYRLDGDEIVFEQEFSSIIPDSPYRFGQNVAIWGDRLVARAPGAADALMTYEFDGQAWNYKSLLLVHDTSLFGQAIVLREDWMAVGDPGTGTVHLFEWNGTNWMETDVLLPDGDFPEGTSFGHAVARDGELMLIGAPMESDEECYQCGAIYLFQFDGESWVKESRLFSPAGTQECKFGSAVSVLGQRAVIGAPGDVLGGSARIYEIDGASWTVDAILRGTDIAEGVYGFGGSVLQTEAYVVVGQSFDDSTGDAAVFVESDGQWSMWDRLCVDATCDLDDGALGVSFAQLGDELLVGDPYSEAIGDSGFLLRFKPTEVILDCNGNGVFDTCDTELGFYLDVDGSQVPDDCEQTCNREQVIIPDDVMPGDSFGGWVDIDGATAVLTSWFDETEGGYQGSVYVFEYDGASWVQKQKLLPDAPTDTAFSGAVALSEGTIAVGANSYFTGVPGEVYVYTFDGVEWTQTQVLHSPDGEPSVGSWVDIDGDTIVTGAPTYSGSAAMAGAAYVFRYSDGTWEFDKQFEPIDPQPGDGFGSEVAVRGSVMAIGAPLDDDYDGNAGAIYVYHDLNGIWTFATKLYPQSGDIGFGEAVDVGEGWIMGGSGYYSDVVVYQLTGSTWWYSQTLEWPTDLLADGGGPRTISISGKNAIVGRGTAGALAYQLDGYTWRLKQVISSQYGDEDEPFAYGVALDGDVAVLGGAGYGVGGAAFVYAGITGPDCNGNLRNDACDLIDGTSVDANLNFIPDECDVMPACEGDANGDGVVDPLDSGYVLSRFGCAVNQSDADCDAADVNGDGVVDPLDAGFVLSRLGSKCE